MPIRTDSLSFLPLPEHWREALTSGRIAGAQGIVLHNLNVWATPFDRQRQFRSVWQSSYPFWDVVLSPLHVWLLNENFSYSPVYGYIFENRVISALSYMAEVTARPYRDSLNYRIQADGMPYPRPGELDDGQFQVSPEVNARLDVYTLQNYVVRDRPLARADFGIVRYKHTSVDWPAASYYYGEGWQADPALLDTVTLVDLFISHHSREFERTLDDEMVSSNELEIIAEHKPQAHVRKGRQMR